MTEIISRWSRHSGFRAGLRQTHRQMKTQTFYDAIAPSYDARFQSDVALVENELATMNLPTRNVLDLGCGTGLYLEYCSPDGYIGLDLSKEMRDWQGVGRCATRAEARDAAGIG